MVCGTATQVILLGVQFRGAIELDNTCAPQHGLCRSRYTEFICLCGRETDSIVIVQLLEWRGILRVGWSVHPRMSDKMVDGGLDNKDVGLWCRWC